jgi:ABC-2 type transport system ATP-binding protein
MEILTEPTVRPTTRPPADRAGTAVAVDGLTKRYGRRTVVDHLSFDLPAGSVTGLIGPNGAGKTTLMAMLLGLVRPSAGTGTVLGHPLDHPRAYLPRVGALIESPAFHPGVSAVDNLRSLAVLGGHDRDAIPGLVELVGLAGREHDRFGSYSLGMKQRLGIAASLLGDPALVVLDEPTNGLDPSGMQDVRCLIGEIASAGRTVVVSSHLLGELEHVCDWLLVIDHGGLVHNGTPEALAGAPDQLRLATADAVALDDLAAIVATAGLPVHRDGDHLVLTLEGVADSGALAADVNRRAHAAGVVLRELHVVRASLEARYLDLIGGDR